MLVLLTSALYCGSVSHPRVKLYFTGSLYLRVEQWKAKLRLASAAISDKILKGEESGQKQRLVRGLYL